jgi:hypothetical protein
MSVYFIDEDGIVRKEPRYDVKLKRDRKSYATISSDSSFCIRSTYLEELRQAGVRARDSRFFVEKLDEWVGKLWADLIRDRRKAARQRELANERQRRRKDAEKLLPKELSEVLIGISKSEGIDIFRSGFRVSILCRSTGYDRRKVFALIHENQASFSHWVRTEVETSREFRRKVGTLNPYRLSQYTVRQVPEIIVIFDLTTNIS